MLHWREGYLIQERDETVVAGRSCVLYRIARKTESILKKLFFLDLGLLRGIKNGEKLLFYELCSVLTLDFNSIAYTWANTDHSLSIGGATTDSDAEAQALIESADRHSIVLRPAVDSAEATENGAIVLAAAGTGEPAAGDSDLIVRVLYATVKTTEA